MAAKVILFTKKNLLLIVMIMKLDMVIEAIMVNPNYVVFQNWTATKY